MAEISASAPPHHVPLRWPHWHSVYPNVYHTPTGRFVNPARGSRAISSKRVAQKARQNCKQPGRFSPNWHTPSPFSQIWRGIQRNFVEFFVAALAPVPRRRLRAPYKLGALARALAIDISRLIEASPAETGVPGDLPIQV